LKIFTRKWDIDVLLFHISVITDAELDSLQSVAETLFNSTPAQIKEWQTEKKYVGFLSYCRLKVKQHPEVCWFP